MSFKGRRRVPTVCRGSAFGHRAWLFTLVVTAALGWASPAAAQHDGHTALPHGVPNFCAAPTVTSVASGLWSSGATWSTGQPPRAGDVAIVSAGTAVSYDASSDAAIRSLCVHGRLAFVADANTRLTVGNMLVMEGGELEIGTEQAPIHEAVTAELVFANQPLDAASDPEQYGTGLMAFGKVRMHGAPKTTFLRLGAEPRAGDTALTLSAPPSGWRVGDRIALPDTRQLNADERFAKITHQFEDRTILSPVMAAQVALSAPLTWNHEGARSADRSRMDFLPHVANLTRNVVIRSANPAGTRGHTMYMHHVDLDIRYVQYQDLGRTTNAPLDPATNHIGRYPLHIHYVMGPSNPTNTGHQFKVIGNALVDSRKWPLTVHESSYGLIQDNVVFKGLGSGFVTENGNEHFNEFVHNFGFAIFGDANPRNLDGRDASVFWFFGFNNSLRDNVAANGYNRFQEIVNGAGYKWSRPAAPSLDTKVPLFRGADLNVDGHYKMVYMQFTPIPEFSGNEAYGAMPSGAVIWHLGTDGYAHGTPMAETVFKNFVGWHLHESAFFGYPMNNVTFDGFIVRGHPRGLGQYDGGTGYWSGDYKARNVVFRNADVQGMSNGLDLSTATEGSVIIESSFFQNYRSNISVPTLKTPGTGATPDSRTTVIRNTRFLPMPAPPGLVARPFVAIAMDWEDCTSCWISKPDRVWVYNYNDTGENFRLFYLEQQTRSVAGGLATCSNRPRPEVIGLVCDVGTAGPMVTAVDPPNGAAGQSVTLTGENFGGSAKVRFGGLPATSVNILGPNTITAVTPSGLAGPVSVVVANADYQGFRRGAGFSFGAIPPPPPPPSPTPLPNTAPSAANDNVTVNEDASISVSVLTNDTDADGHALTITAVSDPPHGTATIASGTVKYTPDANYNGSDSFTYTISDGSGGTASATVSVTVAPVADAPVARGDSLSTVEDVSAALTVLGNDTDADGNALSVIAVSDPPRGSATFSTDGVIQYTPDANLNGTDSFLYTISDGTGRTATATVTVTVTAVNDAPIARNDAGSTSSGLVATVIVLSNDSDVDGDTLRVTSVGAPAHGIATINADGTIAYVPHAYYSNGVDAFAYAIADGKNGSATATVQVTVATVTTAITPSVVNLTQANASATITTAGLVVGTVSTASSNTVAAGLVISQNPAAGTVVPLTSAVSLVVSSGPPPVDQSGLVAAYSFDEGSGFSVFDASGNSRTGTIRGAVWTLGGRSGGALSFDGIDDRITVPDSAGLDLTIGMTLQAWVYPTALSGWRTVMLKERSGGLVYALYAHDNAPRPAGYVNAGQGDQAAIGRSALPLFAWTHLAVTYDGSVERMYVNGVLVGSTPVGGAMITSSGALRIGGNAVWGEYFKGRIDEVRIHNRALSQAEIQVLMATPVRQP